MLNKVWSWIVYSSSKTEYYSATVKGLTVFVPSIVIFVATVGIRVDANFIQSLILQIADVVSVLGSLFGIVYAFIGAVRKVVLTAQGKNDALLNPEATQDEYES